jgi:hypothetical protein
MNDYLQEAAELLRRATKESDEAFRERAALGSTISARRDLIESSERIAMKFAQLGAIEAGLIPAEMIQDLLAAAALRESQ